MIFVRVQFGTTTFWVLLSAYMLLLLLLLTLN